MVRMSFSITHCFADLAIDPAAQDLCSIFNHSDGQIHGEGEDDVDNREERQRRRGKSKRLGCSFWFLGVCVVEIFVFLSCKGKI